MDSYHPAIAPDPETWLALTDAERMTLIGRYVQAYECWMKQPGHHARLHCIIEDQIAEGPRLPVQERLRQLMAQGMDRHSGIHAMAGVLIRTLVTTGETPIDNPAWQKKFFSALKRIDGRKLSRERF